jgi:hypothetical protein
VSSFIFNSKLIRAGRGPISWVLLTTLAMFIYSALLPFMAPNGGMGVNQWQENIIRLERYVFSDKEFHCVITGSSMASRIQQDLLAPNDYNLATSGRSAFVGVETIIRRPRKPKCVIMEVNWTLVQNPDGDEVPRLFAPLSFFLKSGIALFREMNQPAAVLAGWLKGRGPQQKPDVVDVNFDLHFKGQKELENQPFPAEKLTQAVDRLARLTHALREMGIAVIFFDTPREADLMNGLRTNSIRLAIKGKIPNIPWMEFEQEGYHTEDGTHLTTSSAARFTQALARKLNDI